MSLRNDQVFFRKGNLVPKVTNEIAKLMSHFIYLYLSLVWAIGTGLFRKTYNCQKIQKSVPFYHILIGNSNYKISFFNNNFIRNLNCISHFYADKKLFALTLIMGKGIYFKAKSCKQELY